MWSLQVNFPAVVVSGIVIFMIGGLWYSRLLFAKRWVALMGKSEEDLKQAAPGARPFVFVCALLTAWAFAVILNHFSPVTPLRAILLAGLCWVGFAAATSYGTAMFSGTPKALWLINSGYNLISFIAAALILAYWR